MGAVFTTINKRDSTNYLQCKISWSHCMAPWNLTIGTDKLIGQIEPLGGSYGMKPQPMNYSKNTSQVIRIGGSGGTTVWSP